MEKEDRQKAYQDAINKLKETMEQVRESINAKEEYAKRKPQLHGHPVSYYTKENLIIEKIKYEYRHE